MKTIFISYTLKGNDMTIEILKKIKSKLLVCGIFTYIDILDFKGKFEDDYFYSDIELNKNTIKNKYQKNLMFKLLNSRCLCLLESEYISSSKWVIEEILFAKNNNIPIININKKEWELLIQTNNLEIIQKILIKIGLI